MLVAYVYSGGYEMQVSKIAVMNQFSASKNQTRAQSQPNFGLKVVDNFGMERLSDILGIGHYKVSQLISKLNDGASDGLELFPHIHITNNADIDMLGPIDMAGVVLVDSKGISKGFGSAFTCSDNKNYNVKHLQKALSSAFEDALKRLKPQHKIPIADVAPPTQVENVVAVA